MIPLLAPTAGRHRGSNGPPTRPFAVWRAFVLLLAGVFSTAAEAQPVDAASVRPSMTLREAIEAGRLAAPTLVEARGAVTTAQAARRRSLGAYLPTLSANAGTGFSSAERIDPATQVSISGAATSLSGGVAASWDVFTGFRRRADRDRTAAQLGGAEASLEAEQRETVLRITTAFYAALSAERLLRVSSSRIERAEGQLVAARRRNEVGNATRSDVLRAQLELNSAKTQALEVANGLRAQELELGRLVGREEPIRAAAPEEDGAATRAASESIDTLVAQHPSVLGAEAALRSAEAGVHVARAAYFPQARLSAGYDVLTPLPDVAARTGWALRLGLSYPILDGFVRDESSERARAAVATAEARLADVRRAVRSQLEQARDRLQLATERLGLTAQATETAKEDLRVQQERYGLGASTMLDLLASQEALVTAETNAIDAGFSLAVSRAQLEALSGSVP